MTNLHRTVGLLIGFGSLLSIACEASPAPQQPAPLAAVEPDATRALERMSTYLMGLTSFEIDAETVRDLVTTEGQRLQVGGVSHYRVHRPDGFQIEVDTDFMSRRYYFDGKQFTVFAPKLGYYATVKAPSTIRDTLDAIRTKYGIEVPLEDVFLWSDTTAKRAERLKSAFLVGPAKVDGVDTDHYAFREADRDWEIWIDKGERPFPRKLVITGKTDSAHPSYEVRLKWNVSPSVIATDFTFKPGADAKAIHIASLDK